MTAPERIEIVATDARLAEVGPAWTALWRRSGALVFQSHAWVAAWWETVPDRRARSLALVLAWRGDDLVAVLPLAARRHRGLRVLEWAAKDHSDYGDALLAPEADAAVVSRMWSHLCTRGGFDLAYLNRLLPDAAARVLTTPAGGRAVRLKPSHRSEESLRVVGDWETGKAWFEAQSKKTRQNYRRGQKAMGEAGPLRFRMLGPDEPLEPVLARVAALKRLWLSGRAAESDLFDEGSPALEALVRVLAQTGLLRLFVLECGDTVVAVSINVEQAGTMMAFVTTYDPALERGSPGVVLMMDYIQWSIDHGLSGIDFLCGAEPFKLRFATRSVRLDSVVGARTVAGAAALLLDRGNHAVRRLRARRAPAATQSLPAATVG